MDPIRSLPISLVIKSLIDNIFVERLGLSMQFSLAMNWREKPAVCMVRMSQQKYIPRLTTFDIGKKPRLLMAKNRN